MGYPALFLHYQTHQKCDMYFHDMKDYLHPEQEQGGAKYLEMLYLIDFDTINPLTEINFIHIYVLRVHNQYSR